MTKANRPRGGMTAAELDSLLRADPEFVAREARQEEERQKRNAEYRRAEAPLVEELRAAGVVVETAWDLVNTPGCPYTVALPILLDHLQRPYPPAVKEGIARALAVREARFGWAVLVALFREEPEKRVKDGLACAIAEAADDEVIGDVILLVRDPRQSSRVLLLSALERSADPRARATLMELGTDPELNKEIQVILRRRKRAKR